MKRTRQSVLRSVLLLLFAVGSALQQQAGPRVLLAHGCVGADACLPLGGHQLALTGAVGVEVTAGARVGPHAWASVERSARDAGLRSGTDVLFHARNRLRLARAVAALNAHRAVAVSLRDAARNVDSAPVRAPPALA